MSTPSGEVRRSESCDVFISHISAEAPLAEALKRVLQGCLPQLEGVGQQRGHRPR